MHLIMIILKLIPFSRSMFSFSDPRGWMVTMPSESPVRKEVGGSFRPGAMGVVSLSFLRASLLILCVL